ncbi:hypothetical protein PGT21_029251 [Puccinia graminis f. sp. tritici]|uniref:Uncharacterized protein n=1 Tax=Puccinia graminis f. sp. tritici TaxID=56615 RepID=A0A5B0NF25_PUCGR|nr:hypothetical protein PGT21_029251 [Puccinia graminis f. sp. tritici]KAA1095759.1 hypothetical protein PGTUg99_028672 [Puccinia graminis f. sp. tritici]
MANGPAGLAFEHPLTRPERVLNPSEPPLSLAAFLILSVRQYAHHQTPAESAHISASATGRARSGRLSSLTAVDLSLKRRVMAMTYQIARPCAAAVTTRARNPELGRGTRWLLLFDAPSGLKVAHNLPMCQRHDV